ncbi:MAG: gliding motility protein GldL, partial [Muribaculaceae bacterium]|nr:gliding motility protein GldL [Muribaculaceae bacterium]
SIGAAIVIWGALFKILHLPGGNALLSIGMGTEVLMFVLTAFDRPPKEYDWEAVFPQLRAKEGGDGDGDDDGEELQPEGANAAESIAAAASQAQPSGAAIPAGATVIVGAGMPGASPLQANPAVAGAVATGDAPTVVAATAGDVAGSTEQYIEQLGGITAQLSRLQDTTRALNEVSEVLLQSYRVISENSDSITESSRGYVEEMQNLSRNIGGLNTIYEIQLKSISSQLDAIDRVNRGIKDIRDMYEKSADQSARYCEETERMARYMQQLNTVYERMIQAMTMNMYRPMMSPDMSGVGNTETAAGSDVKAQSVPVDHQKPEV